LDNTDHKILEILQTNARVSMKDLGKMVGLTAPAVSERVKKLEDSGVITGYMASINYAKLGRTISAFIDISMASENYSRFLEVAEKDDRIIECYHVTGGDSLILKVLVSNINELEELIEEVKKMAKTNTSIILSTPISHKTISF
jgi:Lrp/AsnC family leucine-responsive transcriptional regulator